MCRRKIGRSLQSNTIKSSLKCHLHNPVAKSPSIKVSSGKGGGKFDYFITTISDLEEEEHFANSNNNVI